MQKADVDIIVIAYNEEARIGACLSALCAQETTRQFRVVVVNDGSTDATSRVVTEMVTSQPRIELVELTTNQGRGVARRTGLSHSSAEFVGFVDADIEVPADWLERCVEALSHADAASGIAVPDGDVAPLARIFKLTPRPTPGSATITGNNVIFRASALARVEFPSTPLGEDFRLAERLKADGANLVSVPGLYVHHNETKSYRSSFKWLYSSGYDASALLFEFGRFRLPDVIALAFDVTVVGAMALAMWTSTGWTAILFPTLFVTLAAAAHVLTRFNLATQPLAVIAACVANIPLMGAYLAGRFVGTTILVWRQR